MAEAIKQILPERLKPDQGKQKPKKDKKEATNDSRPLELEPQPAYIQHRIDLFEKLKKEYDGEVAKKPRDNINITLPDGKMEVGQAWQTTPADIARNLSKSLFERTVISKVNGELWDLERPFEANSSLELLDFENAEAKKVFWHSSAHILGEACERRFGCDLCIGPPVEDGFYYEMALPGGAAVAETDIKPLETIVQKVVKDKQPFERLTLSKENLLEMFKSNKYKQHIINSKIADGTNTSVYRCGPLIDLCRGPHVPHTGRIKAFQIMKNSSSYFLGDANNDSLQRIYGVSFPDKKQLDEHKKYLEEAAKRDHRKIGREQELFFFHDMSPGSCFFLPHGTIIYNTLQALLREEYWKRGYSEVVSPNMYNSELWKQSGHWQHYHEDMFTFDVEKDKWALKPMNCPGHCLMFGHRERSYRELPIRMADFGILHRNEASGALTGLTRVRRFQQDDTHVFCTHAQIESEILALFDFLSAIYGIFGFAFKLKLSTRPEKYLGDIETWNEAETKLKSALDQFVQQGGAQWELNEGDGAFYGPKIDVTISDALKREHQCATIQLDFQLPQQFNLEYQTSEMATKADPAAKTNGKSQAQSKTQSTASTSITPAGDLTTDPSSQSHPSASAPSSTDGAALKAKEKSYRKPLTPGCARPVMIHRAIYGSFERFIAILCEHFAGKWPFWLSPRQFLIVPVMPAANAYVSEVQQALRACKFHADVDLSGNTMQKKIRTGQLQGYNFIFVLGAKEMEERTVNMRDRDDLSTQQRGETVPIEVAIKRFETLRAERTLPKVSPIGSEEAK